MRSLAGNASRSARPRSRITSVDQGPMPGMAKSRSARPALLVRPGLRIEHSIADQAGESPNRRLPGPRGADAGQVRVGQSLGRREQPKGSAVDRMEDVFAECVGQIPQKLPGSRHRHQLADDCQHRRLERRPVSRDSQAGILQTQAVQHRHPAETVGDLARITIEIEHVPDAGGDRADDRAPSPGVTSRTSRPRRGSCVTRRKATASPMRTTRSYASSETASTPAA